MYKIYNDTSFTVSIFLLVRKPLVIASIFFDSPSEEFDDHWNKARFAEDLIKTHLHSKIDDKRCVEIFLLDGESKKIEAITRGFLTNRKMDTVKLVSL